MADSPPKSDPMSVQPEHLRPDRDRQDADVQIVSGERLDQIKEQHDQLDADVKLLFIKWMDAVSKTLDQSKKEMIQGDEKPNQALWEAFGDALQAHHKAILKLKDNKP